MLEFVVDDSSLHLLLKQYLLQIALVYEDAILSFNDASDPVTYRRQRGAWKRWDLAAKDAIASGDPVRDVHDPSGLCKYDAGSSKYKPPSPWYSRICLLYYYALRIVLDCSTIGKRELIALGILKPDINVGLVGWMPPQVLIYILYTHQPCPCLLCFMNSFMITHIYICIHTNIYIYIYILREKERETFFGCKLLFHI